MYFGFKNVKTLLGVKKNFYHQSPQKWLFLSQFFDWSLPLLGVTCMYCKNWLSNGHFWGGKRFFFTPFSQMIDFIFNLNFFSQRILIKNFILLKYILFSLNEHIFFLPQEYSLRTWSRYYFFLKWTQFLFSPIIPIRPIKNWILSEDISLKH